MRVEKQKRERAGVPRCRMYLRNELGWLPGFPVGQGDGRVSWMPVPKLGAKGAEPLELDAAGVRRASRTWATLVRGFPRALPRVVAGLDRWKQAVPLILEWLTGAIERGDPLPALAVDDTVPRLVAARAERLATRRPALRPVLSAASWSGFLAPGDLLGMLGWIEANADAVEGILAAQPGPAGVADVLTLSLLSNEDGPSMSRLLRLAGTARGPGSPAGVQVVHFATWIGEQAPVVRRRALGLLALVLHDGLLDDEWLRTVLDRLRMAAAPENADFHREMVRLLERLPRTSDASFRVSFLSQWCRRQERYPRRVAPMLREVSRHLSSQPDFGEWLYDVPERGWIDHLLWLDDHGESEAGLSARWRTVFGALVQARTEHLLAPVSCADEPLIVKLALATNDAADACRCLRQLDAAARHRFFDIAELRLAFELDTQAKHFATLAVELRDELGRLSLLRDMDRRLVQAGWAGATAAMIVDGQLAWLIGCAQRWAVADALGVSVVEPDLRRVETVPAWARRYPEELQPALGELVGVTGGAERIAAAVLAKDFPRPEDLRREIAAIEKQVAARPDGRHLERLGNLRARLRSPRPVSPVRVDRLRDKLEVRTRRCLLESWSRRLDADLTVRFSRLLQTEEVPAWMFQPRQLRVIGGMLSLPTAFRSLGWRLLRARASSGPWNLVDDPANRAYLARVRKRGVSVEPWLNPRSRSCVGDNGRRVELAFERDPLEVFQMGSHFQTCLSPGSGSFFSVFAVAADINKHVVYARDVRRAVVGRCLLALDDVGRIISFFPYCHDGELGFKKMVGELVEELAGEMKTHVVPRGTVPCLVAPDWYDDGPLDVCRRFPFLEEGSEFRESLPVLVQDELVACLERHFAPVPLNAHALSLVLELPEFDAFPGMVRPLLPLLDGCRNLDDRTWMRAARIAEAAGESDFVGRVLRKRGVRHVLRTRRGSRLDDSVMLMLMEHDPSATIRVVRATRARRVRSDEEDDKRRRLYLARAYELLGRPARARRLQVADAQFEVGHAYHHGDFGVPKSRPAAVQWYRRAAEQGHVEGQYSLGTMYKADGFGVCEDPVEEARWMRQAAQQGHSEAQFEYGRDCEDGRGVPVDWAEAAVWYRRAAEQGHVEAHLRLGDLYYEGRGVERDDARGVHWYRRGGALGDAGKQRELGDRFASGRGVPRDLAEAAAWYRQAAVRGDFDAQFKLGDVFANGRGVVRDDAEAVRWYRAAAERGHDGACFNLGRMYVAGRAGGPPDAALAAHWFRKVAESRHSAPALVQAATGRLRDAAERGEAHAQFHLGQLYAGREPPDDALAFKWLSLAARHAHGAEVERMAAKARDDVAARMKVGHR